MYNHSNIQSVSPGNPTLSPAKQETFLSNLSNATGISPNQLIGILYVSSSNTKIHD